MKQCEKIDLNIYNGTWECLPDMREGRCYFNPCLFSKWVYVCGVGSQMVEAFSPQSDSFLAFQPRLPESSSCCLFVRNNSLEVHSLNFISKFTAWQTGELVKRFQRRLPTPSDKRSNSQPVVDFTRDLYFIYQGNMVLSHNLETGMEVQSFT